MASSFAALVLLCVVASAAPALASSSHEQASLQAHDEFPRFPGDRPMDHDLSAAEFVKLDQQIKELEDFFAEFPKATSLAAAPPSQRRHRRAFHAKGFCFKGTLRVDVAAGAKDAFKQGFYSQQGKEFPVWVRWSNGLGTVNFDALPDVRGMAVKIFLNGDKDTDKTLDLLSTNGPVPTNNSPETLIGLQHSMVARGLFAPVSKAAQTLKYFAEHPMTGKLLATSVLSPPRSFALEQFWSGSPYKVGSSLVKFNFHPDKRNNALSSDPADLKNRLLDLGATIADEETMSAAKFLTTWRDGLKRVADLGLDKDYIKNDMIKRLKQKSLVYKVQLQLFKDDKTTPLEDLFVEWKESDAPSTPVATLTVPKQEWDESFQAECEKSSFNPAHSIPEHVPQGHVNHGRAHLYATSATYRNDKNGHQEL